MSVLLLSVFVLIVVATGTISPLDYQSLLPPSSSFTSLNLLVPSACAVIVMTVILLVAFLVICRKRPVFDDPASLSSLQHHHHEQMCSVIRSDDPRRRSSCLDLGNNTLTSAGMLSILEQRKESCLNDINNSSPTKIYFPSPYAMNQVLNHHHNHHHQQQHDEVVLVTNNPSPCKHHQQQSPSMNQSHLQSQQQNQGISLRLLTESDGNGMSCQSTGQQPPGVTFERLNMDHHTYDIPFPPKWV
jgi:ABC-type nickel/cobalt efflux system permease component RcnA